MKRRVLLAIVLLLAAATANIVVAWSCATWRTVANDGRLTRDDAASARMLMLSERIPAFPDGQIDSLDVLDIAAIRVVISSTHEQRYNHRAGHWEHWSAGRWTSGKEPRDSPYRIHVIQYTKSGC